MQQFPCPWCGLRDEAEFRYVGDAGVARPGRTASDADWAQYLDFRANAKGAACELWIHAAGCGRWFELDRNTLTHDVTASRPMAS